MTRGVIDTDTGVRGWEIKGKINERITKLYEVHLEIEVTGFVSNHNLR